MKWTLWWTGGWKPARVFWVPPKVYPAVTPEGVLPLARAMLAQHIKGPKQAQEDTSPVKTPVVIHRPPQLPYKRRWERSWPMSSVRTLTIAMLYQCMGGG